MNRPGYRWPAAWGLALASACSAAPEGETPAQSIVAEVIDGDTVELENGERVRYLLVDTPEITNGKNDCWGAEAREYNRDLVLGKAVQLEYDEVVRDTYGRLLAYVELEGRSVNELLVERGHACVLQIPPNGADRVDDYEALEDAARSGMLGMWGACEDVTCD